MRLPDKVNGIDADTGGSRMVKKQPADGWIRKFISAFLIKEIGVADPLWVDNIQANLTRAGLTKGQNAGLKEGSSKKAKDIMLCFLMEKALLRMSGKVRHGMQEPPSMNMAPQISPVEVVTRVETGVLSDNEDKDVFLRDMVADILGKGVAQKLLNGAVANADWRYRGRVTKKGARLCVKESARNDIKNLVKDFAEGNTAVRKTEPRTTKCSMCEREIAVIAEVHSTGKLAKYISFTDGERVFLRRGYKVIACSSCAEALKLEIPKWARKCAVCEKLEIEKWFPTYSVKTARGRERVILCSQECEVAYKNNTMAEMAQSEEKATEVENRHAIELEWGCSNPMPNHHPLFRQEALPGDVLCLPFLASLQPKHYNFFIKEMDNLIRMSKWVVATTNDNSMAWVPKIGDTIFLPPDGAGCIKTQEVVSRHGSTTNELVMEIPSWKRTTGRWVFEPYKTLHFPLPMAVWGWLNDGARRYFTPIQNEQVGETAPIEPSATLQEAEAEPVISTGSASIVGDTAKNKVSGVKTMEVVTSIFGRELSVIEKERLMIILSHSKTTYGRGRVSYIKEGMREAVEKIIKEWAKKQEGTKLTPDSPVTSARHPKVTVEHKDKPQERPQPPRGMTDKNDISYAEYREQLKALRLHIGSGYMDMANRLRGLGKKDRTSSFIRDVENGVIVDTGRVLLSEYQLAVSSFKKNNPEFELFVPGQQSSTEDKAPVSKTPPTVRKIAVPMTKFKDSVVGSSKEPPKNTTVIFAGGNWLRRMRSKAMMSQPQMANYLGVGIRKVMDYELGWDKPPKRIMDAYKAVSGVTSGEPKKDSTKDASYRQRLQTIRLQLGLSYVGMEQHISRLEKGLAWTYLRDVEEGKIIDASGGLMPLYLRIEKNLDGVPRNDPYTSAYYVYESPSKPLVKKQTKLHPTSLRKRNNMSDETWDNILRAFTDKTLIEARAIERVNGGLVVDLGGAQAFLPGSETGCDPHMNDKLMEKKFRVRVLECTSKTGCVVVSRIGCLEDFEENQPNILSANLMIGEIRDGVVTSIVENGAFVDIGDNILGLLHWSEIPSGKQLKKGDHVTVAVAEIDILTGKVSLRTEEYLSEALDTIYTTEQTASNVAAENKPSGLRSNCSTLWTKVKSTINRRFQAR